MHATCLGMQAVSLIIARDSSLLGTYDGDNNPSTVQLVPGGAHSRFWRWLPERLRRALQKQPITMENHSYGEHRIPMPCPSSDVSLFAAQVMLPSS